MPTVASAIVDGGDGLLYNGVGLFVNSSSPISSALCSNQCLDLCTHSSVSCRGRCRQMPTIT